MELSGKLKILLTILHELPDELALCIGRVRVPAPQKSGLGKRESSPGIVSQRVQNGVVDVLDADWVGQFLR